MIYDVHVVATFCFDRRVEAKSLEEAKNKVLEMATESDNNDWDFQEYISADGWDV